MAGGREEVRVERTSSLALAFGGGLSNLPKILWRVVRLASRYRSRFVLATLASLGACLAGLALPWLLGRAVDTALALRQTAAPSLVPLTTTGLLLLAAATLRGLLQMLAGTQSEWVGQSVARDLRVAFYDALQRLGHGFHDRVHSGDLITRGMLDIEGTRSFIEIGLQRSFQLALLVGIGAAGLLAVDPIMAAITLSFVPVVAWRAGRMGLRLRIAWTALQERMADLTRVMEESLQGAKVVRALAARWHELERFDAAADEALRLSNERIELRARGMAAINTAYYSAMLAVIALGAVRVANGLLTVGELTQCLAYMTILQLPVRQTSMIMNSAARAVSSGARVFEVLDAAPDVADRPAARPLVLVEGRLRFEQVSFRHADGTPALEDVSFELRRGRTLGVVGASGAGKSTLAALIPRFYDVSGGRITIDGQDVRDVTLDSLRGAVGLIAQDVFLFDDSAHDNLAYAMPDAVDDAVRGAARLAQVDSHLAALPDGYATPIGERGATLSGGQRQRLSIARGLLPAPAILIFDDVTSAVDAATERRLRQALREGADARSTIIISHRLSTLAHADEILVLDRGRIVERGRHEALVAANGTYAALFGLQTEAAEPPREVA